MSNDIDIIASFKMDKSVFQSFNSFEEAEKENFIYWKNRPVKERFYAIEFLRAQWIEMNNLPTTMDRKYFEYR